MNSLPALPSKPADLIEVEARCRSIRAERQAVETELQRIQDERWRAAQGDENLDLAAEAMAAGETDAMSRNMTPERISELRSRLEILIRADSKVSRRAAELRDRHTRNIAAAWRPMHKKAAHRIARALVELAAANAEEERVRARAPGATLPPMSFPNIGRFGAAGGAAQYWKEHAKRYNYWPDEDEDQALPAAAY